jgi:hypothetical protein
MREFYKYLNIHCCFLKWRPFRLVIVSDVLQVRHCDSLCFYLKLKLIYDNFQDKVYLFIIYLCNHTFDS